MHITICSLCGLNSFLGVVFPRLFVLKINSKIIYIFYLAISLHYEKNNFLILSVFVDFNWLLKSIRTYAIIRKTHWITYIFWCNLSSRYMNLSRAKFYHYYRDMTYSITTHGGCQKWDIIYCQWRRQTKLMETKCCKLISLYLYIFWSLTKNHYFSIIWAIFLQKTNTTYIYKKSWGNLFPYITWVHTNVYKIPLNITKNHTTKGSLMNLMYRI